MKSPPVRQQLIDPQRLVGLHADQHVSEVLDGVDVIRLAGRDWRVETGEVLAGLVGPNEEEVPASDAGYA